MVHHEPWSVGKLYHGHGCITVNHGQPWSTMVGNEKPWYHGQTVAGVAPSTPKGVPGFFKYVKYKIKKKYTSASNKN